MGAAFYVVVEDDGPGFDTFINGKALSRECDSLERLASELGVKSLTSFFSQSVEELEDFLDTEMEMPDDLEIPQEKWFEAADGQLTVHALRNQLESNPNCVPDSALVLQDLAELGSVLDKAVDKGIRWHLAVDF